MSSVCFKSHIKYYCGELAFPSYVAEPDCRDNVQIKQVEWFPYLTNQPSIL